VLTQEAPFEMPDAEASMCLSCAMCTQACPRGAVYVL
jgi:Fe-S-cluster-containing hydrogenase component 2